MHRSSGHRRIPRGGLQMHKYLISAAAVALLIPAAAQAQVSGDVTGTTTGAPGSVTGSAGAGVGGVGDTTGTPTTTDSAGDTVTDVTDAARDTTDETEDTADTERAEERR